MITFVFVVLSFVLGLLCGASIGEEPEEKAKEETCFKEWIEFEKNTYEKGYNEGWQEGFTGREVYSKFGRRERE